jgi:uncharacterized protein (DUF1330 family)
MENNGSILLIMAHLNKENINDLPNYLEQIGKVFAANNGKPIGKYKSKVGLAGENNPEVVSIVEFPSDDAIKNMIESEAFMQLAELRARVFVQLNLIICESL